MTDRGLSPGDLFRNDTSPSSDLCFKLIISVGDVSCYLWTGSDQVDLKETRFISERFRGNRGVMRGDNI